MKTHAYTITSLPLKLVVNFNLSLKVLPEEVFKGSLQIIISHLKIISGKSK